MEIKYSFICNVCQNYKENNPKCTNCNGQGQEWEPTNRKLYEDNPKEFMKNLIILGSQ